MAWDEMKGEGYSKMVRLEREFIVEVVE